MGKKFFFWPLENVFFLVRQNYTTPQNLRAQLSNWKIGADTLEMPNWTTTKTVGVGATKTKPLVMLSMLSIQRRERVINPTTKHWIDNSYTGIRLTMNYEVCGGNNNLFS